MKPEDIRSVIATNTYARFGLWSHNKVFVKRIAYPTWQTAFSLISSADLVLIHGLFTAVTKRPDSKVHGANMGPTWVLSAPDVPHDDPMNLAIRECNISHSFSALLQFDTGQFNLRDYFNCTGTVLRKRNAAYGHIVLCYEIIEAYYVTTTRQCAPNSCT